jgi:predicted DNA binding CopG/RHH family protein
MATTKMPKFKSETEEARWWDANRAALDAEFVEKIKQGKAAKRTRAELLQRLKSATRPVTVRLAETDIAMAKQQAERKGLPYQTYIKSLLHEALRKAG